MKTFQVTTYVIAQDAKVAADTFAARLPEYGWIAIEVDTASIEADGIGQHHAGAHDTERQAALAQFPKSGTDRRKTFLAIAASDNGLTDFEGAHLTGLRQYTYAPRRTELLQGGWVADSGQRRETDSGSPAIVWGANASSRRAYLA